MTSRGALRFSEEQFAADAAKRGRWQKGAHISTSEIVNTDAPATSKYNNVKTNGYASKKEARRAAALKLREAAGEIRNLVEQVPYVLIPRALGPDGKVVERAVGYVSDFNYDELTPDGWLAVVEDCKGMRTPDYIIKRKLMRFTYGIAIRET